MIKNLSNEAKIRFLTWSVVSSEPITFSSHLGEVFNTMGEIKEKENKYVWYIHQTEDKYKNEIAGAYLDIPLTLEECFISYQKGKKDYIQDTLDIIEIVKEIMKTDIPPKYSASLN